MAEFDITKHVLVPKHTKLSEKDLKVLLEKYSITVDNLPVILKTDPAIQHLNVEDGDVVKIERKSPTAGKTVFFRRVI